MESRTKYITRTFISGGIIALITWFALSYHFDVQISGDIVCAGTFEEPCEASYNITLTNPLLKAFYIRNNEAIDLVFIPDVKTSYSCKKDGRFRSAKRVDREVYPCGIGWRNFTWKDPLTSRYKYIEKFNRNKKHEYKLVVFKNDPSDEIKWGGKITGEEFDPKFLPILPVYSPIEKCDIEVTTEYTTCFDSYPNGTNSTYRCNPTQVVKQVNCKTLGIITKGLKLSCPIDHRCDIIGSEFCILDCNDGDCNYNAKQSEGRGWSFACIEIDDIKIDNIKIASYKKTFTRVERI